MLAVRLEMQKILSQPVFDYRAREQAAPPQVKARLERLRDELRRKDARFTVSYTTAGDIPLWLLTGTVIPREPNVAAVVNERATMLHKIDKESAAQFKINIETLPAACSPKAAEFDWRKFGKVSPMRAQICGTCWDFAALGAYEASYSIRNNALVDTSEQYVLNCAKAGSCSGGWWMPVFDFLMTKGIASEKDVPFTGNDQTACQVNVATPYRATAWGFVANSQWEIPSVEAIKQALCDHGPLATALFADDAFALYEKGVFDQHDQNFNTVNHGVLIIGWSNSTNAWLIKNSWGPGWGDTGGYGNSNGYMWIAYNTNNVGIATAWVDATSFKYPLHANWSRSLQQYKISSPPLPKQ